jgi:hypothetical protein
MPSIVSSLSPYAGVYFDICGISDKRLDSSYRKRRSNLSNESKICFPHVQISNAHIMSSFHSLTGSATVALFGQFQLLPECCIFSLLVGCLLLVSH